MLSQNSFSPAIFIRAKRRTSTQWPHQWGCPQMPRTGNKCAGMEEKSQEKRKYLQGKEREIQLTPVLANSPGCGQSDRHPHCQMTPVKVRQCGCPWQEVIRWMLLTWTAPGKAHSKRSQAKLSASNRKTCKHDLVEKQLDDISSLGTRESTSLSKVITQHLVALVVRVGHNWSDLATAAAAR